LQSKQTDELLVVNETDFDFAQSDC